jgi:translocation and assembly module TamA
VGRWAIAVAAGAVALLGSAAGPAFAEEPRAEVQGELEGPLAAAIETAVGVTDKPIQNRFEARRRAREAAEDTIAVLRSEGYYAYEVEPDLGEGDAPKALVRVKPGARFKFFDPRLEWVGPPPEPPVAEAGAAAMGIVVGSPGRAAEVVAAEGRIVSTIQKRGYADAQAAPREVVVDHADLTVRPTLRIESGALVLLDGVEVVNPGRTGRAWIDRLATWRPGDPYDPEDVAELERRLLDTGVYDSVTVALAPKERTTAQGHRPIVVSLADRSPRSIELGASYATSEGFGLDGRWTRYNRLGRFDTLAIVGRLSNVDSRLGAELTLPHWRRPQQTLKLTSEAYSTDTDAYNEAGARLRADVQRRFGKTSYINAGASLDFSKTEEKQAVVLTPLGREVITAAVFAGFSLDRSNDPLDPSRGWRAQALTEPTLIAGDETLPYLKVQGQASAYFPFGERSQTVLAGRLKLGSILGGQIPDVPASRRFYAGGGGSVRGFAYQAVGPRLADNTPQGGLSLMEASLEVRHKLTRRWGVVAFLDAGAVGTDQFPTGKDLSAGAGVGIRYDLGFGPIRADIAVPLDKRQGDPDFQIYLSIGQSF